MSTTVVPTLRDGAKTIMTSTDDKVAHLVQFFFANPGNTTEFFSENEVSFRMLEATHETNRDDLIEALINHFKAALSHRCPDENLDVSIGWENTDEENNTYKITMRIDKNGVPVISEQVFVITNNEITLE